MEIQGHESTWSLEKTRRVNNEANRLDVSHFIGNITLDKKSVQEEVTKRAAQLSLIKSFRFLSILFLKMADGSIGSKDMPSAVDF